MIRAIRNICQVSTRFRKHCSCVCAQNREGVRREYRCNPRLQTVCIITFKVRLLFTTSKLPHFLCIWGSAFPRDKMDLMAGWRFPVPAENWSSGFQPLVVPYPFCHLSCMFTKHDFLVRGKSTNSNRKKFQNNGLTRALGEKRKEERESTI